MAESRLQFRHHSEVFDTRNEALSYLDGLVNSFSTESFKLGESLVGEPIIVKYNDIDENGETVSRVILAIGVEGNLGEGVLDVKYHYIDSAFIEKNIEEIFEKTEGFDEVINAIITSAGFNDDGTYSPVEDGTYISKAKNIKSATRLLDAALKSLQNELDRTQKSVGVDDDGNYIKVINIVTDPYEYISSGSEFDKENEIKSITDETKALDKGLQSLKKDSIKNVIFNHGKDDINVKESVGFVNDRVAYLDVTTSNLNLPKDYKEEYQEKITEHHPLHNNLSLSEALAQLEANFHIATGHTSGIHIQKVSDSELPSNVREAYDLVGADGIPAEDSARIFIYKDSALVDARLGHVGASVNKETGEIKDGDETNHDALILKYIDVDGLYVIAVIDLGMFLIESEFKDGFDVNNNGEVRVKIDKSSETIASGVSANTSYLTVSESGVKVEGIQYSIDATVEEEKTRAEGVENTISGVVNTVIAGAGLNEDGTYNRHLAADGFVYINSANTIDEATQILDKALNDEVNRADISEKNLQNEINAVENGVGLNEKGKYVTNVDTNYISAATSVVNATEILDSELKSLDEKVDEIADERKLIYDGIVIGAGLTYNEAGAVIYDKHDKVSDEVEFISAAESIDGATVILDKELQKEITRSKDKENSLQSELDKTQEGAGLNVDGTYSSDESAEYIKNATSLKDADFILDSALKTEEESRIGADNALQSELDKTQEGTGLNEDGTYKKHNTSPDDLAIYIHTATSIDNATFILDKELKNEVDRATGVEGNLKSWVGYSGESGYIKDENAKFISAATDLYNADQILDAKINQIANERKDIYEGIVEGAGLTYDEAGKVIYKKHNTQEEGLRYITSATSIDEATVKLDEALQSVNDTLQSELGTTQSSIGLNENGEYVNTKDPKYYIKGETIVGDINIIDDVLNTIQLELDNTQVGVGLASNGSYTANTSSNYIVEATSLVDADSKLDAALKYESVRAQEAEDSISGEVTTLSATVISNAVQSTGKTINVDKRPNFTNIEVNVDNVTLKNDEDGKIYSTLKIQEVTTTNENVLKSYELWDASNNRLGNRIDIYKDQTLKNVVLNGQVLEFTYILADGSEKTIGVDMGKFLYEGEFKDGLIEVDNVVKIRLADNNENKFLGVSESGLRLHGVQDAIDAAQASATTVVTGNGLTHIEIEEQDASDGHKVFIITEDNIASNDELVSEIKRAKEAENSISGDVTTLSGSVVAMNISHTVSSNDKSINVNKTTDGTDVAVNIDNITLVKSSEGVISNGIKLKELESTEITDKNIWKSFKLADSNGNYLSNSVVEIQVPKTRTINKIDVIEKESKQYLRCEYDVLGESTTTTVDFDINELIAENDISDGLKVENNKVKVQIDHESDSFVSVTASGIRIKGITDAINASKTIVKKGTESTHVTVEESVSDGHITYTINDKDIASADALKEEIITRTAEITDVRKSISDEVNRAQEAERLNNESITAEQNRAILAETNLKNAIDKEVSDRTNAIGTETARAQSAESELKNSIDTEKNNRENADNGLSNRISKLEGVTISGKDAIKVTDTDNKVISIDISTGDTVLTQSEGGLKANISASYDSEAQKIKLNGKNDTTISEIDVNFYIVSADSTNYLDIKNLEVGLKVGVENGLAKQNDFTELSGAVISVRSKVDKTQETLGFNEDGTITWDKHTHYFNTGGTTNSSIKDAIESIDDALADIEDKVTGDTGINGKIITISGLVETLSGTVETLSGSVETLSGSVETLSGSVKDLQDELDRTQAGAGLNENGTYTANSSTNYIGDAESLKDADEKLDSAIKDVQDNLTNVENQIGLDSRGEFHTDSNNKYTTGSTTVKDAIDSLDKALADEIGDDETGGLKKRIKELEDKVTALETSNTNIKETIFDALSEMFTGTSREIKLTVDKDSKTITIGFSDDAIFGNLSQ